MTTTLQKILSVDLILLNLVPYLSISELLKLCSTSREIRSILYGTPGCFRHLDLSTCRSTSSLELAPIDRGGEIWRAERMDESVTEDEFYGGPLRGILSHFRRWRVLTDVQTLVLDRQSVPADLLHEIICGGGGGEEYRVRLLSLLEVKNLNANKFQQTLAYACRRSRPEGRPLLRGVYFFSDVQTPMVLQDMSALYEHDRQFAANNGGGGGGGVTVSTGAQLGAEINSRSRAELYGREPHPAYRAVGGKQNFVRALGWEATLNVCRDVVAFDAVLCRGPRHDPLSGIAGPAIASVFLSSRGCEECGTLPEGPAVAGKSPISHVPLLRPIPLYASAGWSILSSRLLYLILLFLFRMLNALPSFISALRVDLGTFFAFSCPYDRRLTALLPIVSPPPSTPPSSSRRRPSPMSGRNSSRGVETAWPSASARAATASGARTAT